MIGVISAHPANHRLGGSLENLMLKISSRVDARRCLWGKLFSYRCIRYCLNGTYNVTISVFLFSTSILTFFSLNPCYLLLAFSKSDSFLNLHPFCLIYYLCNEKHVFFNSCLLFFSYLQFFKPSILLFTTSIVFNLNFSFLSVFYHPFCYLLPQSFSTLTFLFSQFFTIHCAIYYLNHFQP